MGFTTAKLKRREVALRERWRAIWRSISFVPRMPRDPLNNMDKDQTGHHWESEFGWGAGRFPNPAMDYSAGGSLSRIPQADPDRTTQYRNLAAIRRTDVGNPLAPMDPFVAGNTDRFGAQPPLVRERRPPRPAKIAKEKPLRMRRAW